MIRPKGPEGGLAPIGDIVKSVFRKIESEKDITQEQIAVTWAQAAGEAGFRHSRPASLKRKVLTVQVDNPGWLQQLTLEKRRILKALQRALGKDRISEIHFKIGEF
jgi:predicted nucleic acid-binding Zn ribbon protein